MSFQLTLNWLRYMNFMVGCLIVPWKITSDIGLLGNCRLCGNGVKSEWFQLALSWFRCMEFCYMMLYFLLKHTSDVSMLVNVHSCGNGKKSELFSFIHYNITNTWQVDTVPLCNLIGTKFRFCQLKWSVVVCFKRHQHVLEEVAVHFPPVSFAMK